MAQIDDLVIEVGSGEGQGLIDVLILEFGILLPEFRTVTADGERL